jgi:hypothetical protein
MFDVPVGPPYPSENPTPQPREVLIMRPLYLGAVLGLLAAAPATSQTYTGSFAAQNDRGGQTVVTLRQVNDTVTGTIVGNGSAFQLAGVLEESTVVGAITGMPGGGVWFEAELYGVELHLTLIAADATGQPDYTQMTTLRFTRQGPEVAAADPRVGGAEVQGAQPTVPPMDAIGGALDDGTPLGRQWSQFLAGKKATRLSSYSSSGGSGGYSSRTEVHLCAGGEFALSGSSSVTVDVGDAGGYSAGQRSGQGRWRIITQGDVAGIELRYANGEVEQYRLDYQNEQTLVNGERWFVTPSEACGGGQ